MDTYQDLKDTRLLDTVSCQGWYAIKFAIDFSGNVIDDCN
jgi:hypothetical protein